MKNKPLPKPTNPPESFFSAINGWTGGRLSHRSGFYAGRGVKRCDLNESHLQLIFDGIKKDFSPEHAALFLDFVEGLEDMSATAFLVAFEYFFATGCSEPKKYKQRPGDQYQVSGHGEQRDIEAQCAVFEALGRSSRSSNSDELEKMEGNGIKFAFLTNNGRKPKPVKGGCNSIFYRY